MQGQLSHSYEPQLQIIFRTVYSVLRTSIDLGLKRSSFFSFFARDSLATQARMCQARQIRSTHSALRTLLFAGEYCIIN
ncbi:predicted protein [Coccidioides posadasii str. Silveira]|uniref:Predicted protein n=1 Tax=Coccidioides posadasii (strain RMSCC 757 / Silveira) TaxID=443226 RepID=E9DB61_COCPS|nr:predicted protein [Coccidioides posadasii str. Silveira]